MKFEFETDSDTIRLFEIVAHFLQQYFGYSQERAIQLINSYYIANKSWTEENRWGDDFYHYDGPFRVAALLHWDETKDGNLDFVEWLRSKDLFQTPSAAIEYFRIHYFKE
jgi:hypothetical protein